jgi:hypothetical protein
MTRVTISGRVVVVLQPVELPIKEWSGDGYMRDMNGVDATLKQGAVYPLN